MKGKRQSFEEAWKSYKSFEEYEYQGSLRVQGVHMVEFVREWEFRLHEARAVGCNYSSTTVALKLLGIFQTVLKP